MSSHFEAIGIGVASQDEFQQRGISLISAGTARQVAEKSASMCGLIPPAPGWSRRSATAVLDSSCRAWPEQRPRYRCATLEDRVVLVQSGGRLETDSLVLAALAEDVTVHADAEAYFRAHGTLVRLDAVLSSAVRRRSHRRRDYREHRYRGRHLLLDRKSGATANRGRENLAEAATLIPAIVPPTMRAP